MLDLTLELGPGVETLEQARFLFGFCSFFGLWHSAFCRSSMEKPKNGAFFSGP